MNPNEPNEPMPTTPVEPPVPAAATPSTPAAPPAGPPASEPTRWGAPPPSPPGWGGGGPTWGAPPPSFPPPPPPRRDRLALGIVAFIFGGLFLVFFGFLLLAYGVVKGEGPHISSGPRIGVVEVKGGIGMGGAEGADAERVMKHLRRFAEDGGMKAVLIRIDSPGGAVSPSQEIYEEVKKLAEKKVVVCSMGNLAASGGFYVAMGCPTIMAEPGTLTGSIGVISQFVNVKGLVSRFDIKFETIKSGKLKDMGNPFEDMPPETRAYWQSVTNRIYEQFLGAVVASRKLPEAKVRAVADGRVLTGEDAKALGLIDALGNFYAAVDLAMKEAKLTGEPTLVYPPDDGTRFFERLMGDAAGSMARAVRAELQRDATAAQQPGLYFLAR